jgi:hypothetical protein
MSSLSPRRKFSIQEAEVKNIAVSFGLAVMLAASLIAAAPVAGAKDGDKIKEGSCSGSTSWKLKLSEENGGIETEFEVDQNKVGVKWRVVLRHDGNKYFKGVRTTKGDSGSFEVRRVVNNHNGADTIRARATNLSSGETCTGKLIWRKN